MTQTLTVDFPGVHENDTLYSNRMKKKKKRKEKNY